jgi:hypothetical protein
MNDVTRRLDKLENSDSEKAEQITGILRGLDLTKQSLEIVRDRLDDPERGDKALHNRLSNVERGDIRKAAYFAGAVGTAVLIGGLLLKGVDYVFPSKDKRVEAILQAIKEIKSEK